MYEISVYTDGACSGNPGPGGWAAVLNYRGHQKVISGCDAHTTNNRMELTAVLEAVKALKKQSHVTIHTDSQYVCVKNEDIRRRMSKKDMPNRDLWDALISTAKAGGHRIKFEKVKGHDGVEMNELCDRIAKEEIINARHLEDEEIDLEAALFADLPEQPEQYVLEAVE